MVHFGAKLKTYITIIGSGALSGKMLLIRIFENDKIFAYFRAGKVK